jgi:hypothetical protein
VRSIQLFQIAIFKTLRRGEAARVFALELAQSEKHTVIYIKAGHKNREET